MAGMAIKTVDVTCKNGHLLFGRYIKMKPGFLMKCYVSRIGKDYVGVSSLPAGTDVFALNVNCELGELKLSKACPPFSLITELSSA